MKGHDQDMFVWGTLQTFFPETTLPSHALRLYRPPMCLYRINVKPGTVCLLGYVWTFCPCCPHESLLQPSFSRMHEWSCKMSLHMNLFSLDDLLPWRRPLMMKASQEDAGCTQGCPRQAMLCYSWTMSRTQSWSLDACSRLTITAYKK